MFTQAEETQIRLYLGYPQIYQDLYSHVQDSIDLVGANEAASEKVSTILQRLELVDTALDEGAVDTAGIQELIGDLSYFEQGSIKDLRTIGKGLVTKLSIIMGVQTKGDYFGSSSTAHGFPVTFFG